MAPAADAALPLPVDPTAPPSPPSPSGAGAAAAPASSDRPWYKYLFRTTFFFGGDPERAAARFAAFRHFDKMADTTVSREDIRAFVASDGVYGPRLAADETQATVASWALGTYKHDQVATRAALTAFVQQREQAPPSGATGGGASVASS